MRCHKITWSEILWIDNVTNSANQIAGICDIIDSDHSILWQLMDPPPLLTHVQLALFFQFGRSFQFSPPKNSKLGPFLPKIHPTPTQILEVGCWNWNWMSANIGYICKLPVHKLYGIGMCLIPYNFWTGGYADITDIDITRHPVLFSIIGYQWSLVVKYNWHVIWRVQW